jgi:hypothetical protein
MIKSWKISFFPLKSLENELAFSPMEGKLSKCTLLHHTMDILICRFLDSKDSSSLDYKLDSFSSVYNKLTGKQVVFEFPVQQGEGL